MCHRMWAYWRHLANTTELTLHSAHPSPQHKRQIARFSRVCTAHGSVSSGTLVPPGEYDWNCEHWRHLANTIELMLPLAHPSPQPQFADRSVQPFMHSSRQSIVTVTVPIFYNGRPFPQKLPLPMGESGAPPKTLFPGPIQANCLNGIRIGLTVFAQMTLQSVPILCNGTTPKLLLQMGESRPPSSPPESSTQTASRLVQPFLQGSLLWQTDRQSDRPRYLVSNSRLHLRMQYRDAA